MARPSKREARSSEILDAFERCVIRYGLEGATLQRIADEAQLARSLLRHYVGNRDDLLDAMIARMEERAESEDAAFRTLLPQQDRCRAYVELLFDPRYAEDSNQTLLIQALALGAPTRPALRERLRRWHNEYIEDLERELAAEFDAPRHALHSVAVGIIGLYFNADYVALLAPAGDVFDDCKAAALRLLETL